MEDITTLQVSNEKPQVAIGKLFKVADFQQSQGQNLGFLIVNPFF